MLGEAQIVALIVLIQRVAEAVYATYNTRRLLATGARETARDFYPVLVVGQLTWLAAIFLLVPVETTIFWPLMGLYIALQGVRYWTIVTLGRYWTLRIVMPQKARLMRRGPFRYLAHPGYTVMMMETFLLPVVFGAWQVSVIMTAMMGTILYYMIVLEENCIQSRRSRQKTGHS